MRVGEGLAGTRGRLGTPQAGHGRTVDTSQALMECRSHLPHRHPSGAGAGG